jgi:hypothetical protein
MMSQIWRKKNPRGPGPKVPKFWFTWHGMTQFVFFMCSFSLYWYEFWFKMLLKLIICCIIFVSTQVLNTNLIVFISLYYIYIYIYICIYLGVIGIRWHHTMPLFVEAWPVELQLCLTIIISVHGDISILSLPPYHNFMAFGS